MDEQRSTSEWESQLTINKECLFIRTAGSLTFAPDWAALAGLNKKIALVMGELQIVQEDAKHHQGWKYASYGAVVQGVRESLSKHGVGLYANLIHYQQEKQAKGVKSMVEVEFTFADGETGALRTSRWAGEAMDFGVADKGLNKAYTAAEKFFLMRTFLVSTSDDAEPDATSEPKTTPKSPAKAKPRPHQRKPIEPMPPSSLRPYPPETVKAGVLSRAAKGDQVIAEHGFRGLVIGYLEAVWMNEEPDTRAAKRHSVLDFIFGDPSSKRLTTGQCKALLDWLTDTQPDKKPVLNADAVAEAISIVLYWDEQAGQQRLEVPPKVKDDGVPSQDIPI